MAMVRPHAPDASTPRHQGIRPMSVLIPPIVDIRQRPMRMRTENTVIACVDRRTAGTARRQARHSAGAFTLFEVAISLVILAVGVITVMGMFPAGLKAQQMSRFQLYAAAKAEEMVEQFSTAHF